MGSAKRRILIAISIPLIMVGIDGFVLAARLIPRRADADADHRRPAGGV